MIQYTKIYLELSQLLRFIERGGGCHGTAQKPDFHQTSHVILMNGGTSLYDKLKSKFLISTKFCRIYCKTKIYQYMSIFAPHICNTEKVN